MKRGADGDRLWIRWVLGLAVAGLGVSIYLWMGKRGNAPLICGLSGGCVSVNASPYSEVFGVPVAALGALMYLSLAAITLRLLFLKRSGDTPSSGRHRAPSSSPSTGVSHALPASSAPTSVLALIGFVIALAGSLFSLYLTAIEAFVLRAYCMWCLISWGLVTTITVIWAKAVTRASGEVSRG